MKRLLEIFWEFFRVSLFVVGGGYAIIAVADAACARRKWTREGELVEALPVFQMVPGLIAAHTAVYVGRRLAGIAGAAVGVFAVALPSVAIFTLVSAGYDGAPLGNPYVASAFTGLRAALVGIIAATLVRGWRRSLPDLKSHVYMVLALAALFLGVPVWQVVLVAVAAGLMTALAPARPAEGGERRFRSSLVPFLLFLEYGALCFGGGFVLVPMYMQDFVGASAPFLGIAEGEFADLVALTQMTPGPIGVNAATFFGYRLAGVAGALAASAALLLPGSVLAYLAFSSLERFRFSRFVAGVLNCVRPVSTALMLFALFAFAGTCVFGDGGLNFAAAAIAVAVALLMTTKKPNPVLLIVLSAFVALAVRADDVTLEKFPDADTVVVDECERVEYRPDGTYDSVSWSKTKILTECGRREEGVVSLSYSKRYGEAAIEYVGIIGPDGAEREVDVSTTTKETTDNDAMASNIYDPLDRRIVCTVPGLAVGDTLHVRTRRRALKPRCEGMWSDISVMEWSRPILRSVYEVVAPKERPLRKVLVRHPLGNVARSERALEDGSTLYTFVATNSPRCFPEPDMPPLYTQVQNVRVSTAADWREVSRWYAELCAPHIAKTNAEMAAMVEGFRAECGGDRQALMRRVFRFVSQEVRYMGLTMEDTSPGYAPHDVDITFDNRYGVCRDKAALLVAMLRLAGFRAFPVLIHVGAKLDPEVPQPFFNHAIAAAEGEGGSGYVLMDPTNENTADLLPAYLGDRSYLVCRAEGEGLKTTPVESPERNGVTIRSRGTLAKGGSVFLETEIKCSGINDTAYRGAMARRTGEDRTRLVERMLSAVVPGAQLVSLTVTPTDMRDTETPVSFHLAATFPDSVLEGETMDELRVPFVGAAFGVANYLLVDNVTLERRRFPLVLDTTAGVDEQVEIDLGGNLGRWRGNAAESSAEVPGRFLFRRGSAVTNGVIVARRVAALPATEISPDEYLQLRGALKRTEAIGRENPAFDRDQDADAHVRYLLDSSAAFVRSPREWTVTNRVVKKILDYTGKKQSAELRFDFNPAVEAVGIMEASVSNLDGRVYFASERESNTMDAGWAASAPRYPASKIVVVNLPSVEIGSVVSYTVVRAVTNAPAPFYAVRYFDSRSPLERRVVQVDGWRREVVSPRRLAREPNQPDDTLWRDCEIFSSGGFDDVRPALLAAADVGEVDPRSLPGLDGDHVDVKAIRDWMAINVKVAGPSLYEVPLKTQLTPPETVLKERYASRLDYVRTLAALLRGAGYRADVVFAADNADADTFVRCRDRELKPNVRAFSYALCRVTERIGAFLWFGGEKRVTYIGTENHYAPLGPTAFSGADCYDPAVGAFEHVTAPSWEFEPFVHDRTVYTVGETGSVDIVSVTLTSGPAVAAFRRRYSELLPEEFRRHYQRILSELAKSAVATGPLVADVTNYPARLEFACTVPDLATVTDGVIELEIPGLSSAVPVVAGNELRRTPYGVANGEGALFEAVVRFPEGYTEIEHLPAAIDFSAVGPDGDGPHWMKYDVAHQIVDGRLEVTVSRRIFPRRDEIYPPSMFGLFREWSRLAAARANRTIVVRKRREQ